ncbi:prepilin-type N-terminal cleavage/methylation domain-containing protein [Candidatus Uhrbacteria bacterium]|nr:prepilin-type N-terminal cleavage/methylation domain-containing protein [Candidatus Uhrbacteria bacterium]
MRSPLSSSDSKGFTLLEVVIALGIFALIFSLGPYVGMDLYRSHVFRSDILTLATLLRKARSQSLHRIDGAPHGVSITSSAYVFFTGDSYALRRPEFDIEFPAHRAVAKTGLPEIVFSYDAQVSHPGTIVFSDGSRVSSIVINSEGGIDGDE